MLKKSIYLIIIFILSFILFNYLSTQSKTDKEQTSGAASFLINQQSTDPKRLFLKTWRITKNKYYDPTMNNQDWERWNRRYVDKIKTQEDANVAIDSMIASLNDPYTQYLDREEYKEQTTSIDARIMGIGINIVSVDGNVLIVSVVEGTPAEETGIKAGDIILTVDGKDVRGKTVSDVASLIRGKEGQSVKIELLRNKTKLNKLVTRREIKIKSVKTKLLDKSIGYVQITSFISGDVTKEFIGVNDSTVVNNLKKIVCFDANIDDVVKQMLQYGYSHETSSVTVLNEFDNNLIDYYSKKREEYVKNTDVRYYMHVNIYKLIHRMFNVNTVEFKWLVLNKENYFKLEEYMYLFIY